MLLGEALVERKNLSNRLAAIQHRLKNNVVVVVGEQPEENPGDIIREYSETCEQLEMLIAAINRTNSSTWFDETERISIADAIATRDILRLEMPIYTIALSAARNVPQLDRAERDQQRYNQEYVPQKHQSLLDIRVLTRTQDQLAETYRKLDTRLQHLNWTVELVSF